MKSKPRNLLICTVMVLSFLFSGCGVQGQPQQPVPGTTAPVSEDPPLESQGESLAVSSERICEYETQELSAQRDWKEIYGVITIPQNAGDRMPAVIFSHGFGGPIR